MKRLLTTLLLFATSSLWAQVSHTPISVEAKPWVKGKHDIPWKSFETRIVANLHNFTPTTKVITSRYGSDTTKRYKATGFFRTVLDNGRWWIVDPYGFRNYQLEVVGVRRGTGEQNKAAFAARFGKTQTWIDSTAQLMHSIGFYGSGCWSDDEAIRAYNKTAKRPLTYTPFGSFMAAYGKKRGGTYQLPGNTGYPNQTIFCFDAEFEAFCDEKAKELTKYKKDKNIFGYLSDNEMPISLSNLEGYLTLENPNDAGRKAAEAWLKEQGITKELITDAHRAAFAGVVAERYYSVVSKAIKKHDPKHLYLGARLHGGTKKIKEVLQAAGRYCDVLSINYYGDWTPNQTLTHDWGAWAGKPFMITEFYTKGEDSGLGNTGGAGFTVKTQQDRGYAYQHFTLGLLQSPNCVGWSWFRYQDNDPTAKGADPSNIDSNKGIVNNDYKPYIVLTDLMKELNANAYRLIEYFDK